MVELTKIREVSLKYDISTRELKYYEDIGLIKSTKSDDYAYRLYDENALKRLEQILILKKLNINNKDIQRIFISDSCEVVLEVLKHRITSIDDENATDKLEKAPDIKIIELPKCRMATSGTGERNTLKKFDNMWMKLDLKRKDKFFPRDFMWHDKNTNKCIWWYAVEEWVTEADTNGFKIIDFEGGIYAAAISKQEDFNDGMRVYNGINEWVNSSESFELDEHEERPHLWHVVGSQTSDSALGYRQIEIFVPIKLRAK